jgi:hypothetical protein
MRRLFHVQDSDRPMYVVASDWKDAIDKWKDCVAHENDMEPRDVDEPLGIHMVCDDDDLICDVVEYCAA